MAKKKQHDDLKILRRKAYLVDLTDPSRDVLHAKRVEANGRDGNLFSSELTDFPGMHAPTLDIDAMDVHAIPSTTKGNYHLYIDKPMTWEQYRELLIVLMDCGILSEGFVGLSLARKASFLRMPGVSKKPEDVGIS